MTNKSGCNNIIKKSSKSIMLAKDKSRKINIFDKVISIIYKFEDSWYI